ncbi:chemotaxis protein CheW [Pseudomonas rubra]|uniref:Chemotaxis protein CheW n=1 Tax=Pseudomonas rubra TaxID=2942627 RepID=A0ABT5P7S1_9PSED|nr:chemotaxis protein CheW [Pseudomonas rubra]MDD1014303.1 chemotaxis protein CheW [Pseudomonas rubra]MDD1037582.1 chemotaxis protein CheW [Pseudomonas rubra]MDD1155678.1 chemotaxis protein CheW [Pseudomonas rubra]
MMGDNDVQLVASDAASIDDCWNRIGVHGDKSCPLLDEHIHCRNCEVYAAAATRLLDRYSLSQGAHEQSEAPEQASSGRSLLLFRLGEEWLALATRCLVEVAPLQQVHSLPHQRSRVLHGVANVRGALVPCLSLGDLLGLESQAAAATSARVMPRMLIIAAAGGSVVVQVDEVDGIHGLDPGRLTAEQGEARFTAAVLQWRGRSVRVLDEDQVLSAVNRSLS